MYHCLQVVPGGGGADQACSQRRLLIPVTADRLISLLQQSHLFLHLFHHLQTQEVWVVLVQFQTLVCLVNNKITFDSSGTKRLLTGFKQQNDGVTSSTGTIFIVFSQCNSL